MWSRVLVVLLAIACKFLLIWTKRLWRGSCQRTNRSDEQEKKRG